MKYTTPSDNTGLNRRTFLFGALASGIGILAKPLDSFAQTTNIIHSDEILRAFEEVCLIPQQYRLINGLLFPIGSDKSERLMYKLKQLGLSKKARWVKGRYFPNGSNDRERVEEGHSWIEYVPDKRVIVLDPEKSIIIDSLKSDKYSAIASPRSLESILKAPNSQVYGDGILKILESCSDITYKTDIENNKVMEYWQTPSETENCKTGDCEDQASRLVYKLNRLLSDMPSRFRVGKFNKNGPDYHAWASLETSIQGSSEYIFEPVGSMILRRDNVSDNLYLVLDKLPESIQTEMNRFKTRLTDDEFSKIFPGEIRKKAS